MGGGEGSRNLLPTYGWHHTLSEKPCSPCQKNRSIIFLARPYLVETRCTAYTFHVKDTVALPWTRQIIDRPDTVLFSSSTSQHKNVIQIKLELMRKKKPFRGFHVQSVDVFTNVALDTGSVTMRVEQSSNVRKAGRPLAPPAPHPTTCTQTRAQGRESKATAAIMRRNVEVLHEITHRRLINSKEER